MTESIRKMLEEIFRGINSDVVGIEKDILMTPADAFAGSFWENLLSVCAKVFMPFAIMLLAFFVAAEMYNAYCKSNGEIDIQLVSTTVFKFIIPFTLITRTYDLIELLYTAFNNLVRKLSWQFALQNAPDASSNVDQLMSAVESMNFFEKLNYWMQLAMITNIVKIIGVFIFVMCYGRLFEVILFWLVAPLPLSTLVHNEHSQIGKNYLKMFMALALQGVLIYVCLMIHTELLKNAATNTDTVATFVIWQMIGYNALLAFVLSKTGGIAKRIMGTF